MQIIGFIYKIIMCSGSNNEVFVTTEESLRYYFHFTAVEHLKKLQTSN